MIDGVKIKLGGADRIVAPLNIKTIRKLSPKLHLVFNVDTSKPISEEVWDTLVEAVMASLRRNYPEITQDEVEEFLDLRNMGPIMRAVMASSGLVETNSGEAAGP